MDSYSRNFLFVLISSSLSSTQLNILELTNESLTAIHMVIKEIVCVFSLLTGIRIYESDRRLLYQRS